MVLKKIPFRKSLKALTLLLTSMLIATASAAVYYSITMEPKVTTTALFVKFVSAGDTPGGSTVNDAWCRLLLKSYPNATLTYEQAVNISNTDSGAHSVRLRHINISPSSGSSDVGNFTRIKFYLLNENGVEQTTFEYTTTGNSWNTPATTSYYSIPGNTKWIIKAETLSPAGASIGIECNIQIAVDVQE